MVELKIKDVRSLNAMVEALRNNGYEYSTFVVWDKKTGCVDFFTIRIEVDKDGGK